MRTLQNMWNQLPNRHQYQFPLTGSVPIYLHRRRKSDIAFAEKVNECLKRGPGQRSNVGSARTSRYAGPQSASGQEHLYAEGHSHHPSEALLLEPPKTVENDPKFAA